MADQERSSMSGAVGFMVISALIFGYFGFLHFAWNSTGNNGEFLLFVVLCEWTLKGSAVLFALAAILTMAGQRIGLWMYSVGGLVAAILLLGVAVLDWMDPGNTVAGEALELLLAILVGYGSIVELRALMAARESAPGA